VKTALITGITGQDGSYLAELLLAREYRVVGVVRRSSTTAFERIAHLIDRLELLPADLLDQHALLEAVRHARPDEIYHLAAQSVVQTSWTQPVLTGELTALGTARMLEAWRGAAPDARFYQAGSSEMFGHHPVESPQRETTPFAPATPYGVAKVYAQSLTRLYRESLGLFAVCGILYNHESPRRGLEFVSRKVTDAVARIAGGAQTELRLGALDARRDWGFAGDYVEAMWRMVQQDAPRDYVIGTGRTHSVAELCEVAFSAAGLDYRRYVVQDERFLRDAEGRELVPDPARARTELGWMPRVSFEQLITMMVDADLVRQRERQ
jgi:GDPmannose 4,6-dehydratase